MHLHALRIHRKLEHYINILLFCACEVAVFSLKINSIACSKNILNSCFKTIYLCSINQILYQNKFRVIYMRHKKT